MTSDRAATVVKVRSSAVDLLLVPLASPPVPSYRPTVRPSAEGAWLDALVAATMADLDDDLARLDGVGSEDGFGATDGARTTAGVPRRRWRAARWKATPRPRRRH